MVGSFSTFLELAGERIEATCYCTCSFLFLWEPILIDEYLDRIKNSENRAKASISEAEKKAAEIIEEAHREGRNLLEDIRARSLEKEKESLEKARLAAEEKISKLREKHEKEIAGLLSAASRNKERAIEIIIKEFRSGA